MKEYAVYKGEDILAIGTVKEISKALNVKQETVRFWATPSYAKRIKGSARIAIRLED